MLEDVNNSINQSILNSLGSNSVNSISSTSINPYSKDAKAQELIDQGEISQEAIAKYEAEAELAKYTSVVLDMLQEESETGNIQTIADLLIKDEYKIDNETLAESILNDEDAKNLLS